MPFCAYALVKEHHHIFAIYGLYIDMDFRYDGYDKLREETPFEAVGKVGARENSW